MAVRSGLPLKEPRVSGASYVRPKVPAGAARCRAARGLAGAGLAGLVGVPSTDGDCPASTDAGTRSPAVTPAESATGPDVPTVVVEAYRPDDADALTRCLTDVPNRPAIRVAGECPDRLRVVHGSAVVTGSSGG